MRRFLDLTDQVFGNLTVRYCEDKKPNGKIYWRCDCSCGNKNVLVASSSLVQGLTISCGCVRSYLRSVPGIRDYGLPTQLIKEDKLCSSCGETYSVEYYKDNETLKSNVF
jgi:hypothetical protein